MQRVFEIQSNWDEREKLRQFAISRPPVIPPWPIEAPAYKPDSQPRYPDPSNNNLKVVNNPANNSGPNGFSSFLQNIEKAKNKIDVTKMNKLIKYKNTLEQEIKETKKQMNQNKLGSENFNGQFLLRKNKNISPTAEIINYEYKADEIYRSLKNSANVDLDSIKTMIAGKSLKDIDSLIKMVKLHPEIISFKNPKNLIMDKNKNENEKITVKNTTKSEIKDTYPLINNKITQNSKFSSQKENKLSQVSKDQNIAIRSHKLSIPIKISKFINNNQSNLNKSAASVKNFKFKQMRNNEKMSNKSLFARKPLEQTHTSNNRNSSKPIISNGPLDGPINFSSFD